MTQLTNPATHNHPNFDRTQAALDAARQGNTMDLGGFSVAWLRDLAFCAALEAERDSW
jgi:hypothetical protein